MDKIDTEKEIKKFAACANEFIDFFNDGISDFVKKNKKKLDPNVHKYETSPLFYIEKLTTEEIDDFEQ